MHFLARRAMNSPMIVKFERPHSWISYNIGRVASSLVEAKASVISLTNVPYQRAWAEKLQDIQLKQEVAGTSRIEGAEFTENELNAALANETADEALTRSQKQARAAVSTYKWTAKLPADRPIDAGLILETHRRIVTGCDDDHCEPGALRRDGENVIFGTPRHRGAEGGRECKAAFGSLVEAVQKEFNGHDVLVQALALHYHIGSMHPFLDGNGRTARAVEALLLQRAGLRDALFIALSNYYYDEKANYLRTLSSVREQDGDLTEFLIFGLKGIAFQCRRLLNEINTNISKALFRDIANDLFNRLPSTRKRAIGSRQLGIIHLLLEKGHMSIYDVFAALKHVYNLKEPWTAFLRDIFALDDLRAIEIFSLSRSGARSVAGIRIRLSWPTEITETEFFQRSRDMPRAKNIKHLEYKLDDKPE